MTKSNVFLTTVSLSFISTLYLSHSIDAFPNIEYTAHTSMDRIDLHTFKSKYEHISIKTCINTQTAPLLCKCFCHLPTKKQEKRHLLKKLYMLYFSYFKEKYSSSSTAYIVTMYLNHNH